MPTSINTPIKSGLLLLVSILILGFSTSGIAKKIDVVTTYKDDKGWKIRVNDEDFYIKGVVYGPMPKGETHSYDLWGQKEEYIKAVLDHDMKLMKKAGINAIRSFFMIPPKWIQYIYEKYGVMSIVNPLMGRYGNSISGKWQAFTDYSDDKTRVALKKEVIDVVNRFKDTPGVLMFALGNESNYGLEWSSFEIENLPEGEQHKEKAKSLYSLYNEIIVEAKKLDSNHLFTIVNGDIQYIDLIKTLTPSLDLLGTNVYRGVSATDMWKRVDEELDLPIVFMEFGSDAFNAKEFREDQFAQADILKQQWLEMYNKAYGQGGEGNSVGGFVFEWRDEWWKYKQSENLDIHDRTASWSNGGYKFDFTPDANNMNEEWFGITSLGDIDDQGVYQSEPRMALDVLTDIWAIDPYATSYTEIKQEFSRIDLHFYHLQSNVRSLKLETKQNDKFKLVGGSFSGINTIKGQEKNTTKNGENGLVFTYGMMADLDFAFQPTSKISGEFTLNVLGDVAESDMEFVYGDRGRPVVVVSKDGTLGVVVEKDKKIKGIERVEMYSFKAKYNATNYDLEAFYHVPRYHWGDKGDFFGLLRETTDMEGQDIWNSKAPFGIEYSGKKKMKGLNVVFGPEIYWGANPKVLVKYQHNFMNMDMTYMLSEDIAQKQPSITETKPILKQSRQLTVYAKKDLFDSTKFELGAIMSNNEKVGQEYDRYTDGNIYEDKIRLVDTLGLKTKLSTEIFGINAYVAAQYSGLVADAGEQFSEAGTKLPYSSLGNKRELEAGALFSIGDFSFYPRALYRQNIVEANPSITPIGVDATLNPGIAPRNLDDDPFAVLDNRALTSLDFVMTYDPTPGTYFYDWDNDIRENADFAYNLGMNFTRYSTDTDSYLFFYQESGSNAAFGEGLKAEDVWLVHSKMVYNPRIGLRITADIEAGVQQTTGTPDGSAAEYTSLTAKAIVDKKHIYSAYIKNNAWGPYDFQRQFNVTYPVQLMFNYTRLIDSIGDEKRSSKIGIKTLYRGLDNGSPGEYLSGKNKHMYEISTYFTLKF